MPYILYKSNGTILTTIDDASIDLTTDLSLVGRNYAGYGQSINENLVRLLENFADDIQPARPIAGQLWFNTLKKTLQFSYNGRDFKPVANIFVQTATPSSAALSEGDLWWDKTTMQLKVFDGLNFPVIGPLSAATSKAFWSPDVVPTDAYSETPILKAVLDNAISAVVSYREVTPAQSSDLQLNGYSTIKRGISLPGTNAQGSSEAAGYFFWGSASHSQFANTATYALNGTNADISQVSKQSEIHENNGDSSYYVTFSAVTTGTSHIYTDPGMSYNPNSGVLQVTATAAYYADVAERYHADSEYDMGTVLVIGGSNEVTICQERASTAVAGIVSENAAYLLNAKAGTDKTHPAVALVGRVYCKVKGPVKKGERLVTSKVPGHAEAFKHGDDHSAVIGKALESFEGHFGMIEVKV